MAPSHGTALPDPGTGSFLYTHDGSPTTSGSLTYVIDDALGETSNVATVSVTVTDSPPAPIVSDDFNRPALDPLLWTIEDPFQHGSDAIVGAGTGARSTGPGPGPGRTVARRRAPRRHCGPELAPPGHPARTSGLRHREAAPAPGRLRR